MNKKDKDLLIKDLSARVFYGVKVNIERDFPNNPQIVERIAKDGEIIVNGILAYDIYYYKPYLRPMSSMNSKEWVEYCDACAEDEKSWVWAGKEYKFTPVTHREEFLNSHHFDYRGLIPMGLALEAPERMYEKF